ncbi:xanthine dehydrogenase family protein molybdopterin-binding subunit [Bradyrhizobium sp. CCBAU 51627]|uniref:xanthine dehydrogenase family protein molybdopterin-binding subunit n=1 Tax=Bradyrhizobium sp. CCBAU 51627 TaxID=1325088 RepID=UPI002306B052|nr:molybdopterin cofactor-binding domain-containing protein [Bradyrhizobium sp. CCBAU 51627]MDA9433774.1 isoquinoline 1-oxidoreductase [Bradyrhizobium sp. CCBAU 51627]
MARLKTIARRTFLVGSAAVVGGVAFGYYSLRKEPPNPLLKGLKSGQAAITPYVRVDSEGVTLITPRADKGQGAYSIQAHLIAEELDVDPHKVRIDPGPPDTAYFNSRIMDDSLPFATIDEGVMARGARGGGEVLSRLLGMQITGGSSTVPDGYHKLRVAGAVARETLKEAAARRSGVPRSQLKTSDGRVILPDGKSVSYAELAAEAAQIAPITDVALRPEKEWRYIGKNMRRIDIVAKSTGTQRYGIDVRLDGMVYATVRTNPGMGGTIKRYDASNAEKMRGVKKIVPIKDGVGVIADNTWRAFHAAEAIKIEWNDPPYPADSAGMWKVLEGSFSKDQQDSRLRNDGDVEKAFAGASKSIEAEYRTPYLAHAPLEPMNAVVLYTKQRIDIWTGTQIPVFLRAHAAKLTQLPEEKVYVHAQPIGGSFGARLDDTYALQAIELAMAMEGVPVKMTWSREENMAHDYPRPIQLSRAKGSVRDGKVESMSIDIAGQSMGASWFNRLQAPVPPGPDTTSVNGIWDQPFSIPNYRVTGYRTKEMVPVSPWRSVGASGNGFHHASFLDELIYAAGADPMSELIRLCNHEPSKAVLHTLRDISDWKGVRLDDRRARGVALTLSFGVPMAQVVEISDTAQGIKIEKVFAVCDVGRILDPINFEAQVQGGIIWALGHAMNCELTYENFAPNQTNFHVFEAMRFRQVPEIIIKGLELGKEVRGLGEPPVPPAAPALANAIFALTGKRVRELPLNKSVKFA